MEEVPTLGCWSSRKGGAIDAPLLHTEHAYSAWIPCLIVGRGCRPLGAAVGRSRRSTARATQAASQVPHLARGIGWTAPVSQPKRWFLIASKNVVLVHGGFVDG